MGGGFQEFQKVVDFPPFFFLLCTTSCAPRSGTSLMQNCKIALSNRKQNFVAASGHIIMLIACCQMKSYEQWICKKTHSPISKIANTKKCMVLLHIIIFFQPPFLTCCLLPIDPLALSYYCAHTLRTCTYLRSYAQEKGGREKEEPGEKGSGENRQDFS